VPYYNGGSSLLYSRQSAEIQYQAALARGDRRGAKHLGNALRKLNRQVGAQGYANVYAQPYSSYPYSYNNNYNNGYYNQSPVGGLLGPMLQQFLPH